MFFFVSPDHLGPTHDDDHGVILCAASGARIVTYFFLRGYDRNITHATAMADEFSPGAYRHHPNPSHPRAFFLRSRA